MHKKITLYVEGRPYQTYSKTLQRHKHTFLAKLNENSKEYCSPTDRYYIEGDRKCFEAILFYYQSGILSCPSDVPAIEFVKHCETFELPSHEIQIVKTKECVYDPREKHTEKLKEAQREAKSCRGRVWNFLEKPETSFAAKLYAIYSLSTILLSICTACLETLKSLDVHEGTWGKIELVINCWFLFEIVIRFAFSPNKWKFLIDVQNWIDAIAVFPYFVKMFFVSGRVVSLNFFRCFRFVRVLRLFRLSKRNERMQIFMEGIKKCGGDFQMLFLCAVMVITLGASVTFYLEDGTNQSFHSIPNTMYWCVVTLTTVGYGDISPVTYVGQVFTAFYIIFGTLTVVLPVIAIANTFINFYVVNIPGNEHVSV